MEVPSHGIDPPECLKAAWSRDNHLGNGIGGFPLTYNWTIPDIQHEHCAFRMRYNISTDDYDAWNATGGISESNIISQTETV